MGMQKGVQKGDGEDEGGAKALKIALVVLGVIIVIAIAAAVVFMLRPKPAVDAPSKDSLDATAIMDREYVEQLHVTISFAGDCTLGTDELFNPSTAFPAYYESEGPDYFFAGVKDIFDADDLTVVNCEGVLTNATTRADKEYAYKGDPSYADIFARSSVEATGVSNNHIYDYGWNSRQDTIDALNAAGLCVFGDDILGYTEVKGVKIALIAGNMLTSGLGAEANVLPLIDQAKDEGASIIIVDMHWGEMQEYNPLDEQIQLAHDCIDEGATIVVGSHQHVLQGYEKYNGRYIVYGLGNFCYGGSRGLFDPDCYIFQQTFTFTDGQPNTDDDISVIPCLISSDRSVNNYQPVVVDGEEKARVEQKIADSSAYVRARGL